MIPYDADQHVLRVAARFLPPGTVIHSLTTAPGGFSGAKVISLQTSAGRYALRSWRKEQFPAERAQERHRWLSHLHQNGIPVAVPRRLTDSQQSVLTVEEMSFQLEPWLPGEAVSRGQMTQMHWQSLMTQLAGMHLASTRYEPTSAGAVWFQTGRGIPPAIAERRSILRSWTMSKIVQTRSRLTAEHHDFTSIATKILAEFLCCAPRIDEELAQMESLIVPLFPCWRDLWNAHALFVDGTVTGFIDPTASRTDHVSSDLSRLLGSFLGDDLAGWQSALNIYETIRPLTENDQRLIRVMDRSSVLLSGMIWIDRWCAEGIPSAQLPDVLMRLETFHSRMKNLFR